MDNNTISQGIKRLSLNSIIKWRDKYSIGSPEWDAINTIKSLKLEVGDSKFQEKLKVIDNTILSEYEGFIPYSKALANYLESNLRPLERCMAEFNPKYRQIVCCALIRHKSDNRFMFLSRKSTFTDQRLCGYSGLVGGHMNTSDENIDMCLLREVSEEINGLDLINSVITPVGFIRTVGGSLEDNISNEHLCCLYIIDVDSLKVNSKSCSERAIWYTQEQLNKMVESDSCDLDSWAKIAIKHIL